MPLRQDLHFKDAATVDYLCYVLLDFARLDRDLESLPLMQGYCVAEHLGITERFGKLIAKELGLNKRELTKLKKEAADAVAEGGSGLMSSPGREFLERTSAAGGMHADDVLTSFLPLLKQVADWHDRGLVAPPLTLDDLTVDEHGVLGVAGAATAPTRNISEVEKLQRPLASALNVVGQARITSDNSATEVDNLQVQEEGTKLEHPVYLVGYRSWEQSLGHHDALTDIFYARSDPRDVSRSDSTSPIGRSRSFAAHRSNLFALNARTAPGDRRGDRRDDGAEPAPARSGSARDRASGRKLPRADARYRPRAAPGLQGGGAHGSPQARAKCTCAIDLFEISRRNRLLYFKPSQASVNLTVASVPMVINLASVRLETAVRVAPRTCARDHRVQADESSVAGCGSRINRISRARSTRSSPTRGAIARSTASRSCGS